MNIYDATKDIRDLLGESTAAHWSDRLILRTLNRTHRRYYLKMSMTMGDWFVKRSDALTPSSQAISIPADCAKPIYLEEVSSRQEITMDISIRERAATLDYDTSYIVYGPPRAYVLKDTIVINKLNYSNNLYLWYEQRCQNLHAGTASAGGSNYLDLEDSHGHSQEDDYYNGLFLEVISGTGAGTRAEITDYVASTRRLTVSGTFDSDSVYGMVPLIPDEAYDAWIAKSHVALLSKASGVISEEYVKTAIADARDADGMFNDWCQTRVKNTMRIRQSEGF